LQGKLVPPQLVNIIKAGGIYALLEKEGAIGKAATGIAAIPVKTEAKEESA
jgi:hypothetical protein